MTSLTKKIFVGVMALCLAFTFTVVTAEEDDIREEMAALEQMLADLAAQLGATVDDDEDDHETTVAITGIPENFTFTQNLRTGSRGTDVKYLQIMLNATGFTVAETGAGSPGNETEYFGPRTDAAVKEMQTAFASEVLAPVGLTTATGFVGPQTRAKLNSLLETGEVAPAPTPDNEILEALSDLADAVAALSVRVDRLDRGVGEEGDLTITTRGDIRNAEVRGGQTKDVAVYRLEAENSDVTIQRIDVYIEQDLVEFRSDIDNMTIKVGGDVIGERAINRNTVDRNDDYIRFSGLNVEIEEDGYVDFTIGVTVADKDSYNNTTYGVGFEEDEDAIRGIDGAGITQYARFSSDEYKDFTIDTDAGDLEVTRHSETPEEGVVLVSDDSFTEVDLLKFTLEADGGDFDIEALRVDLDDSDGVVEDLILYHGTTEIDVSSASHGVVTFSDVDLLIEDGETLDFTVVADVQDIDISDQGSTIKAELLAADNTAGQSVVYDILEDEYIGIAGNARGYEQGLYVVVPSAVLTDSSIERNDDRTVADATMTIDITALGGDLYLIDRAMTTFNGDWTEGERTYSLNADDMDVVDSDNEIVGDLWAKIGGTNDNVESLSTTEDTDHDTVFVQNGELVYETSSHYEITDGQIMVDGDDDDTINSPSGYYQTDIYLILEGETETVELVATNSESGWVRFKVNTVVWNVEDDNEYHAFGLDSSVDDIDALQTGQVNIQ